MKTKILLILSLIILLIISACTAGANTFLNTVNPTGEVAGFWQGLWHGFIGLFTFIISLFKDNVSVYEVHNNGGLYNFGFIFGMMMFWGGGSKGTCRRKK